MYRPAAVILRVYQKIEHAGGRDWTKAAFAIARAHGVPVLAYWWPYRGTNVRDCYKDVLDYAETCGGLFIDFMASDFETYYDWQLKANTIPLRSEVDAILDEAAKLGRRHVAYSTDSMLALCGRPDLGSSLRWPAGGRHYHEDVETPVDMSGAPTLAGAPADIWQFKSVPLDFSVCPAELLAA